MFLKFTAITLSLVSIAINKYEPKKKKNTPRYNDIGNLEMAKNNDKNKATKTLEFAAGAFYIPKDNKARPQGEDAHFICKSRNVIGVADGVGGNAEIGIDAGEFARELMSNAAVASLSQNKGSVNPRGVLESAFKEARSEGTSTACIIALNDDNTLSYVNLGDSGFILLRESTKNFIMFRWNEKGVLYRSPVQHHAFNFPYQLGIGSPDTPDSAHVEEIHVEDGDIIVAATDGLFDNVYEYEIEGILDQNEDADPHELARKIAELALSNSRAKYYFSPFAKAAYKEGGCKYIGGKYDDITERCCCEDRK